MGSAKGLPLPLPPPNPVSQTYKLPVGHNGLSSQENLEPENVGSEPEFSVPLITGKVRKHACLKIFFTDLTEFILFNSQKKELFVSPEPRCLRHLTGFTQLRTWDQ